MSIGHHAVLVRPGLDGAGKAAPREKERPLRRRAAWRQVAYMETIALRHDLDDLCDKHNQGNVNDIRHLLKHARLSLADISGPWAWFQGTAQEQTFLALHEAQWRLLLIMKPEYLLSRLPALITFCDSALGADDQRVGEARGIVKRSSRRRLPPHGLQASSNAANSQAAFRLTGHERATVATMVRDAYIQADEDYAATRGIRNRILLLTAAAAVVLALVIGAAAVWHWALTPTATVAVNGSVAKWSDVPPPAGAAAFLAVSLLGCLGAFLSGIRSVSRTGGTRNPFSLSWWQTWLKLPVGALSAIVGVFALQSRSFPAVPATSWTELLMWAVAFGAAQQAITRFVDIRVRGLVGDALGEDEAVRAVSPPPARSANTRKRAASAPKTAPQADSEDA